MRKFILVFILLMAIASAAGASQTGGLVTNVGEGGLSLSAGISYITKDIENGGPKEEMSARQLIIKGSYGLLPNLDLSVKLGFADIKTDNFEGRLDALYGVGLKFKLFSDPEDKVNVFIDGEVSKFTSSDSATDAEILDYNGAFVISNKAGNMTPYGGIKVSQTEVDISGFSKFRADKNIGIVGGVDYFVNPNVFFTGEVNIFDQDALYIGAGYKF
ncbi:MAG: hypothetical protein AAB275_00660 [Deltaproteobacteria bacterium]